VRSRLATLERESSETTMFYLCSIAVFMLLLWALGVATTSTLTSAVGVLAVVAIALFFYRLVQRDRRRPRR
jgi:peptidoglycan/LPS O-acetylase OafA/YrhL